MLIGKRCFLNFPIPVVIILFFALAFANFNILVMRGHGIKFEREFDKLGKTRKILLVTSCAVLLLATIVFFIHTISAYKHHFHL